MKQVIEKIKETISECEAKGKMFNMPSLDRDDVKVKMEELESLGASLYRCEYRISFDNGGWILIKYASKDKCCTFQDNPDRSVIEVTCSDPTQNFTDGWDEGLY